MNNTVNLKDRLGEILDAGCKNLGVQLHDEQRSALVGYVLLMDKWNKAYNLTSVRDPQQMMVRHVLDSLSVAPHLRASQVIDVGTGPGLPGIPLAIMQPGTHFTLLDSLGKRVRFLKQCAYELQLENVTPIQSRVEAHTPDTPYDVVLSRAFASLKDMLHWCAHLVDSKGQFLALKGQFPQSELDEVSNHFHIDDIINVDVPDQDGDRHLVFISKA
ncbi:16S rRNA (guanine(527)-N(7))-methyltransferase RsmG [Alteromonas halophila]|uniref:Ribosomal RNA small subunit methyltransferase G n=1 Tax=Alteromonas halophila TaxID=516698 RepID=A0A918JR65_9ALTE|nr:16S rRNA (guanine(527)-N(7))-methyltransferase RsmG [Alteromonas halophila]GGW96479.1 ribosomal RNA small subunit methyltransferase G [Alteromonas halophila]